MRRSTGPNWVLIAGTISCLCTWPSIREPTTRSFRPPTSCARSVLRAATASRRAPRPSDGLYSPRPSRKLPARGEPRLVLGYVSPLCAMHDRWIRRLQSISVYINVRRILFFLIPNSSSSKFKVSTYTTPLDRGFSNPRRINLWRNSL